MKKKQVIFINGAVPKENFASYYDFLKQRQYNPFEERFLNRNKTLGEKLGTNYDFLRAPLQDQDYADYGAWKICFERMFPFLDEEIILVTSSLGSTFLLKYMIETGFSQSQNISISKLFFLAAALHDSQVEKLGSFSFDISHISSLKNIAQEIYIYHSTDDSVVSFSDSEELFLYFPDAVFRRFSDRGHFYMESELPEIVEDIKR